MNARPAETVSDPSEMYLPRPPDVEHGEMSTRTSFMISPPPRPPRPITRLERRRNELAAARVQLEEGDVKGAFVALAELVGEWIESAL